MKTPVLSFAHGTSLAAIGGLLLISSNSLQAADAAQRRAMEESKPTQFVYVGGEVAVPQRYVYTNGMTLRGAIRAAKGVTAFALPDVTLTREGEQPMTINRKELERGKAKDITLQPGDKVFVPRKP